MRAGRWPAEEEKEKWADSHMGARSKVDNLVDGRKNGE